MKTGQDYTIKVVKIQLPEHVAFVDMMRAEYEIGSCIDDPVIRKVYELRMIRRRFRLRGAILFMEYVDGVTMSCREFRATLDETLSYFAQAASGLGAMHRAGFVHADLKPNNLLVTPDKKVKLIDLGQSSRLGEAKRKVQGTPDYIAPEQVQRAALDQRTDVFGLGAALHRVLTGKPVTTQMNQTLDLQSETLVLKKINQHERPAIEGLPAPLAQLIRDCCAANPADRPADMAAFLQRLELARSTIARRHTGEETVVRDVVRLEDEAEELVLADDKADTDVREPPDLARLFDDVDK